MPIRLLFLFHVIAMNWTCWILEKVFFWRWKLVWKSLPPPLRKAKKKCKSNTLKRVVQTFETRWPSVLYLQSDISLEVNSLVELYIFCKLGQLNINDISKYSKYTQQQSNQLQIQNWSKFRNLLVSYCLNRIPIVYSSILMHVSFQFILYSQSVSVARR
jgi:hypothetical protein